MANGCGDLSNWLCCPQDTLAKNGLHYNSLMSSHQPLTHPWSMEICIGDLFCPIVYFVFLKTSQCTPWTVRCQLTDQYCQYRTNVGWLWCILHVLLNLCLRKVFHIKHYVYPCQRFSTRNTLEDYNPQSKCQQSFPLILITKKGVNLSSCVLAKPGQLLSIIICLFKRSLFLIKPEDLFDLVGFWEC
jgi:hypothetical protein